MNQTLNDPAIPPAASLFHPIEGPRGLRLALIFGNEAPGGRCPFFESQCHHCDLGAGEGVQFTTELNQRRLEFFRDHYREVLPGLKHLVIYNSGSTLNPVEMSPATQALLLRFLAELPACRRVSFDSREAFISAPRISALLAGLRPEQTLSLTLGVESQNDIIRQDHLGKHMSREHIERAFALLGEHPGRTAVDMNLVFQPPGIVGLQAVEEAQATVQFGLELMDRFGVPVDFNYHPYYPSWKGLMEFPEHPRAILEDGIKALIYIVRIIKEHGGGSKVFVGWNDEGHDQSRLLKERELRLYAPGLLDFNMSQDEKDLRI
jgi:hypothetical protein